MRKLTAENNFYYLFGALVVLLFSSAMARELPGTMGKNFFSLLIILMVLLGLKSLRTDLGWRKVVWGFTGLLAILAVLERLSAHHLYDYLSLAVLFLYFLGSLWIAGRRILFTGRVNANTVAGSLSLYLLLGLIWTTLYLLLLTLDPHALKGLEMHGWQEAFPQVAYYSFVTLTTLGYGDILPGNRVAEFLAYMEAIAGVFYMAIVVASLVSIAVSEASRKTHEARDDAPGSDAK